MARGVNKVILIGNLGADPETRYTESGGAITTIKLATSESWKDRNTGQQQERTEWHRVKFFGRLAEIAGEYLKKGRQAYIEGSIRTDRYTDKEGVERFSVEIVANDLQMLGGGEERSGQQRATSGGQQQPRDERNARTSSAPARSSSAPQRGAPARTPAPVSEPFDDGDIPF